MGTNPRPPEVRGSWLSIALEETFAPVLGPEKPDEGTDSPWKLLQLLSDQPPQGNRGRLELVLDE